MLCGRLLSDDRSSTNSTLLVVAGIAGDGRVSGLGVTAGAKPKLPGGGPDTGGGGGGRRIDCPDVDALVVGA